MCGFVIAIGNFSETEVKTATQSISYRGPDETDFFFSKDSKVKIGFNRLSIIDIDGGKQPFKSENGKTKCDNLIKQHQFFLFNPKTLDFLPSKNNSKEGYDSIGPLWVGKLFDKKLVKKMAKSNPFPEEQKFLDILEIESKKDLLGFIDPHVIAKKYKLAIPKKELLKKKLKASSTIFSPTGLKTEKSIEDIVSLFK